MTKAKKTPETDKIPNRLDFLFDAMSVLGMTCEDAGRVIGISSSAVSYWRAVQDCRLSQAEAVLASRGLSLSFAYVLPGGTPMRITAEDLNIDSDGNITVSSIAFIGVALRAVGMTWSELCQRLHVDQSTSRYWKRSSIMISRIWEIAEVCGFDIDIRVEKKTPEVEHPAEAHKVLVTRHLLVNDACVMECHCRGTSDE